MTQSVNQLKQIGLATHNYHDTYGQIPPAGTFADEGQPYHSWQTMLLPFLESSDLYSRIDFDQPWTAPINRSVFQTQYASFINPCEPEPVPVGGYAASHYAGNSRVFIPNGQLKLSEMRDGTSTTILAGQVSAGLTAWGDPTNTRDPAMGIGHSPQQFGRSRPAAGIAYFLMADGVVRVIGSTIGREVLEGLSTPAGGEEIPSDF